MSLPRPKRRYRVTEPSQQPQKEPTSSGVAFVTGITSFFTLVFELDIHLFSSSFHRELRPARAGEGGTFSVRHFQLQFDNLGFGQNDTYDDGHPMRGGDLSRGHRIITKHVTVESDDPRSTTLDKAKILKPLVQELRVLAHPPLRDHPNIIDIFGVAFEKQSDCYGQFWPILVIEYAPGGNLMEFLALSQHPTWSTSLRMSQGIVLGLLSLHDCGVIHADLKPENVLIVIGTGDHPVAKICDFGFAIIKSDYLEAEYSQTLQIQLSGFTPRWLAPEARQGWVLLDQAHMIDVYAFGLIFALVVMGSKDPFEVDERALSLEQFQALQDSEGIAATAIDNIYRLGYNTERINFISKILHGTLVSTPDRRQMLELIKQDLRAEGSEELYDDEEAIEEGLLDSMETASSQSSSAESVSAFDSEISPPFHTETGWTQGLFEPDAENLDELLLMPLAVQNEIYEELRSKALGSQAPIESYARSDVSQLAIIKEVAEVPYLLCALLLQGLGGTQNVEEAIAWLIVSAKAGCQRARLDLPRIISACRSELPTDVQALTPGWVVQEVLAFPDRFALDTLESLDPSLFAATISDVERRWRLCTSVPDLWDITWFDALFNACAEFYNFVHHSELSPSFGFGELGPWIVSRSMADADGFLKFLLGTSGEPAEIRALRDYGLGLGWVHFLANFGMAETLHNLLDNLDVDISRSDFQGRTPLYFATICGNSSMVEFLLDQGARAPFGKNKKDNTCLHFVTSFQRHDISRMVERLAKVGVGVNALNCTGSTPLHMALKQTGSATSNLSATEALLRCGADPCMEDSDGEMPHYWTVVWHQPEALELLLEVTQNRLSENEFLTLKANLFDQLILVPQIDMASFAGSRFPQSLDEIVQLLLDEPILEAYKTLPDNGGDGAFYCASARGKLELMRSICRCFPSVDVNEREIEYNRPAMQYAIRHNKRGVVETLLSLGANLFYKDLLGENALHVAATYAPELLDLILERSRKENKLEGMIQATSTEGFTPLDKAVMSDYLDAAKTLINLGASYDQIRCLGEEGTKTTTLGYILSMPFASLEQIDLLTQLGANSVVSEDGSTVFHALARRSQNIRDEASTEFEGDSSRLRIFDILYHIYPDAVHNVDSKGRTPLHLASWNVLFHLAVRLSEVGVDVKTKDREGMTALDHLRSRRVSQKFEPRYLLLLRNFEREMDTVENWLRRKMHEV